MGILDNAGLKKLQEHLLSKGDQNGINSLLLGRRLVTAKFLNSIIGSEDLESLIGWCEDQQFKIGGRARIEYTKSLEYLPNNNNNNHKRQE